MIKHNNLIVGNHGWKHSTIKSNKFDLHKYFWFQKLKFYLKSTGSKQKLSGPKLVIFNYLFLFLWFRTTCSDFISIFCFQKMTIQIPTGSRNIKQVNMVDGTRIKVEPVSENWSIEPVTENQTIGPQTEFTRPQKETSYWSKDEY